MTFYTGLKSLILTLTSGEFKILLGLFQYFLPFVSFVYDSAVAKSFYIRAHRCYVFFKIIVMIEYFSVHFFLINEAMTENKFSYLVILNQIGVPLFLAVYNALLIRGKLS